MNPKFHAAIAVGVSLSGALTVSHAQAAGFQLFEQSVSGLGTAFASTAAAEDASTVWTNPAGMSYLSGGNFTLGGHIVKPTASFENNGSRTLLPTPSGLPMSGGNGGDAGGIAVLPNLYYAHSITDRLSLGIGVNSPFGLTTEYDDGWVGRYHALKSALTIININPSAAWKINDSFSIGGGLNLQYAKAELTSAIDFSTACIAGISQAAAAQIFAATGIPATPAQIQGAVGAQCGPGGFTTPGNSAKDGKATIKGDNWGYGINLGFMWQIVPSTRLGLSYRSSVEQELDGDATYQVPAGLPGAVASSPRFANTGVKAEVDLPESVSLGLHSQIDEQWALMGDLTWTKWSRFEELRVKFNNGAPDNVTTEKWDDSFRIAIGGSYKPTSAWTLRAGVAYDQSPVPEEHRTPRIPDNDRTWLSFGANWKITQNISLDFGYAHIFVKDASVNLSAAEAENNARGSLKGNYSNPSVDIISIQYNHRF
jgi:long-chain fatty acid transport protein